MPQLLNIIAMLIFGTIGFFVKEIALSSAMIAWLRTSIGAMVLLFVVGIRKERMRADKKEWGYILLSACFLVGNWVFLFQGFAYTTIASATMIYYVAPLLIVLISTRLYHQHISHRMMISLLLAMLSMVLISYDASTMHLKGILYAFLAACCYAGLVLTNRNIHMNPLPFTFIQLALASILLFPYVIFKDSLSTLFALPFSTLPWILGIGILHTGIAYTLYFTSLPKLRVEQAALYSYIDPCTAILVSMVLLHEPISILQGVGMMGILFALFLSGKRGNRDVL